MKAILLVAVATMVLAGCAHMNGGSSSNASASAPSSHTETASSSTAPTTKATPDESGKGVYGNPPSSAAFSKVKLGMSPKHVIDLIGSPTDQTSYLTGKAWIPFYFGRDRSRLEYRYKGEGVITFSGAGLFHVAYTVYRVIYNPHESGYEH